MALKLYNTLANQIEEFRENVPGQVKLYTCGPTVYDFAHIGNLRAYMFEDLLKRYLLYRGYRVFHVMNITDIDDKTIKKANANNTTIFELTKQYTKAFYQDLKTLNILPADVYPKATEHIDEMVEMVEILLKKGYAYQKDGSIYFSIKNYPEYGKLANIDPENLKTGTSVDLDEYNKENAQDFVLWKGKKPEEPSWETDFGEGRPGWHLECSAMSMKYLGNNFDIHAGGVDNIFPHHENEIAQSQAATGEKFVNYWAHCQHLIVDNEKMSKSTGNFFLLRDIIDKGYSPRAIRFLLISTHYRKLLNFTFKDLKSASTSLERIDNFIFMLKNLQPVQGSNPDITALISTNEMKFQKHMDNDLNISGALGTLFDFISEINKKQNLLKSKNISEITSYLESLDSVLGIIESKTDNSINHNIEELISQRNLARKNKNFTLADQIRNQLKEQGITLIDTPTGTKWKKF
jgi:cysteinyl-tRNA synthetase